MGDFEKQLLTKIIIGALVIAAIYFFVLRPILTKLGIIQSSEDKARDKQAQAFGTTQNSPFNPSYYKGVKNAILVTRATAEKLADQLYDAIGNVYDDENAVYGALRQLKTKTQLSWVADVFTQRHQADLYQYLARNLSDSEMDVVNGIANNLI